jgi:hypothetical protein
VTWPDRPIIDGVLRRQQFANYAAGRFRAVTIRKIVVVHRCPIRKGTDRGDLLMTMNGEAVLENVRRYRTIASLYRQTAAFRPHQRLSLLEQAQEWEDRAVAELEDYFVVRSMRNEAPMPQPAYHPSAYASARWAMAAAA